MKNILVALLTTTIGLIAANYSYAFFNSISYKIATQISYFNILQSLVFYFNYYFFFYKENNQ